MKKNDNKQKFNICICDADDLKINQLEYILILQALGMVEYYSVDIREDKLRVTFKDGVFPLGFDQFDQLARTLWQALEAHVIDSFHIRPADEEDN